MFYRDYSNFVKPTSSNIQENPSPPSCNKLSGEEARKLYLEEVENVKHNPTPITEFTKAPSTTEASSKVRKRKAIEIDISDTNLFLSAQNNDVSTLKEILNACPDKINTLDEFGWSLLMIACQANSAEVVKELLKRGIDTSVRDKAGNSACTLVIKNKNSILADILLNRNEYEVKTPKKIPVRLKEEFTCEICNSQTFPDKQHHLSSTIHNINASKGKKVPPNFVIPPSNKGYQIMLKEGWDNKSGLGKDGCGKKYPVKAVQKLDKKGLGLEKKKSDSTREIKSNGNKLKRNYLENRRFEINFRREFY